MKPPQPAPVSPPASLCPFGPALQEFWDLRHELFARFDEGIRIDGPGLFGVKPEALALATAKQVKGRRVLDALCGIGGTVIAFARAGKQVVTADVDPERLEMARENARIYGVADRIEFHLDDVRELMGRVKADAVYLDPPWGGPAALDRPWFGFSDYRLDGTDLLRRAFALTREVVLSVPPNFDPRDLVSLDRDFSFERQVWHGETIYANVHFR